MMTTSDPFGDENELRDVYDAFYACDSDLLVDLVCTMIASSSLDISDADARLHLNSLREKNDLTAIVQVAAKIVRSKDGNRTAF